MYVNLHGYRPKAGLRIQLSDNTLYSLVIYWFFYSGWECGLALV